LFLSKSQIETRNYLRQYLYAGEIHQSGTDDFEKRKEKSLVDFTDDVGYRKKGSSRTEQLNLPDGTPNL
jgi:hypothetical protein